MQTLLTKNSCSTVRITSGVLAALMLVSLTVNNLQADHPVTGFGGHTFKLRSLEGHYVGNWKDGKPHGYGVWSPKNSTNVYRYEGEWKDGEQNGYGVWTWKHLATGYEASLEGEWKDGESNGYGVWNGSGEADFADDNNWGVSYEGEFKDSFRDGYGINTFSDGRRWEGEWKKGKKHKGKWQN